MMKNTCLQKTLSLLVAMVMLLAMFPLSAITVSAATTAEFAGGSGTEEDPYLIETKEHLNNVRNHLDAHYKMIADIVFTDADFSENGDFYNDGKGWNPIGDFGSGNINAIFDGHGHTITGLKSKQDAVYVGLFSGNKGTIKDLKILDAEISVIRDRAYIGTLAATNVGEIVNCYVSGNVSGESNQISTEIYVGGLVGRNAGNISYCSNNGTITAIADKSSTDAYAGGISGYSYDDSISFCKNYGTILSSGETRYTYAGGITGENYYSNIISCINFGSVTASGSYSHAGGITSNTYGTITSCYNTGIVRAIGTSTDKQDIAGGIAAANYGTISKSYNAGSISGIYVGGIAGKNNTTHIVTNCYNTAEISASRGTFAYLGGIVGMNDGIVEFNYNVGKIRSGFYSAGVVGENRTDGEVSACYYLNTCALGGIDAGQGETTACSDSQLKLASTFAGFNFESVWELAEGNMYLYPTLRSAQQYVPNENYRFTIVFYDDDGSVISENQYSYGEVITEPAAPTKAADNTYTYTFAGWDKPIVNCVRSEAYTAIYTSNYIDYIVEFKNWDGTVLSESTYHYGDSVVTPVTPSRNADKIYTYEFTGWDKEITSVSGNVTYTATYTAHLRKHIVIVEIDGEQIGYPTLIDAISDAPSDSTLQLISNVEEDVVISKNLILDLNSFDIFGNITVTSGATLSVKDSQTDDYTIEDDFGYGKIVGTISGVQAENGYLMITEADGVSFHRLNLDIATITFRPSVVGIYYQCHFGGDEVIKRNIKSYGIAMGADMMPNFAENTYTQFDATTWNVGADEDGNANNLKNGSLLYGIMKTDYSNSANTNRAQMQIYGQAYIELSDGSRILGSPVNYSLKEIVEGTDSIDGVDDMWDDLTDVQKEEVITFYNTYKSIVELWIVPNIKSTLES